MEIIADFWKNAFNREGLEPHWFGVRSESNVRIWKQGVRKNLRNFILMEKK